MLTVPFGSDTAATIARALEASTPYRAEDLAFDITVLPLHALRQAPLSSVDERPMRRASLAQLRQLLAEDEIAGYERGLP